MRISKGTDLFLQELPFATWMPLSRSHIVDHWAKLRTIKYPLIIIINCYFASKWQGWIRKTRRPLIDHPATSNQSPGERCPIQIDGSCWVNCTLWWLWTCFVWKKYIFGQCISPVVCWSAMGEFCVWNGSSNQHVVLRVSVFKCSMNQAKVKQCNQSVHEIKVWECQPSIFNFLPSFSFVHCSQKLRCDNIISRLCQQCKSIIVPVTPMPFD